jgi:hypothetical protein
MTYPHWQGVLADSQVEQVSSKIITGIGVYGLSHAHSALAVGGTMTLDFTRGHFQTITLNGVGWIEAYAPPGPVIIRLQVTQGGAGGFYLVPSGMAIATEHNNFPALFSAAPGAVDLIELRYTGTGTTWFARNLMADAQSVP